MIKDCLCVTNGEQYKYYYIHTFGCQMNVSDSEKVAFLLEQKGYRRTEDMGKADIVIVNTCSVREKAEQKAHSLLGRLRQTKTVKPHLVTGVVGCLAQQWGARYFKKMPHLDFVCGTHNIDKIPAMIEAVIKGGRKVEETRFYAHVPSLDLCVPSTDGRLSAFVTIMQGCNNFCSYCIVPYVRGREESRPSRDIVREISALARQGVKEITLLGQNVNSYGSTLTEAVDFSTLLKMVSAIEGIERIRFTTSHPKDFSEALIDSFVSIDKVCEHIHLPVQSGSNEVLKRMGRGYTIEEYVGKLEHLMSVCPSISITTDIIVGFPGETDEYFQKTIDLMKKVRFDNIFSFKYSDRLGVAAAGFDGKVPETIKAQRLQILQALQSSITLEKNRAQEGKIESVLVEGTSKGCPSDVTGRTRGNRIVNFTGSSFLVGTTVPVRIAEGYAHSLRGRTLSGEER